MASLPRQPKFWRTAFLVWFAVLWVLSSLSAPVHDTPPIGNFDKVEHFGYFFGGSGLLSAWLFRESPDRPNWKKNILTVIGVIAIIGILDEFHQTFTPGRSGNDPFDWLADVAGATTGAFLFRATHRWLN